MRVHGGLAGYIAGAGGGAPARGQIPLRRLRPPPDSVSRSALFEIDGLLLQQWSPPRTQCRLYDGESSDFVGFFLQRSLGWMVCLDFWDRSVVIFFMYEWIFLYERFF